MLVMGYLSENFGENSTCFNGSDFTDVHGAGPICVCCRTGLSHVQPYCGAPSVGGCTKHPGSVWPTDGKHRPQPQDCQGLHGWIQATEDCRTALFEVRKLFFFSLYENVSMDTENRGLSLAVPQNAIMTTCFSTSTQHWNPRMSEPHLYLARWGLESKCIFCIFIRIGLKLEWILHDKYWLRNQYLSCKIHSSFKPILMKIQKIHFGDFFSHPFKPPWGVINANSHSMTTQECAVGKGSGVLCGCVGHWRYHRHADRVGMMVTLCFQWRCWELFTR